MPRRALRFSRTANSSPAAWRATASTVMASSASIPVARELHQFDVGGHGRGCEQFAGAIQRRVCFSLAIEREQALAKPQRGFSSAAVVGSKLTPEGVCLF